MLLDAAPALREPVATAPLLAAVFPPEPASRRDTEEAAAAGDNGTVGRKPPWPSKLPPIALQTTKRRSRIALSGWFNQSSLMRSFACRTRARFARLLLLDPRRPVCAVRTSNSRSICRFCRRFCRATNFASLRKSATIFRRSKPRSRTATRRLAGRTGSDEEGESASPPAGGCYFLCNFFSFSFCAYNLWFNFIASIPSKDFTVRHWKQVGKTSQMNDVSISTSTAAQNSVRTLADTFPVESCRSSKWRNKARSAAKWGSQASCSSVIVSAWELALHALLVVSEAEDETEDIEDDSSASVHRR